jgi:hypothetical protein
MWWSFTAVPLWQTSDRWPNHHSPSCPGAGLRERVSINGYPFSDRRAYLHNHWSFYLGDSASLSKPHKVVGMKKRHFCAAYLITTHFSFQLINQADALSTYQTS